jgi:hypothetical protein
LLSGKLRKLKCDENEENIKKNKISEAVARQIWATESSSSSTDGDDVRRAKASGRET